MNREAVTLFRDLLVQLVSYICMQAFPITSGFTPILPLNEAVNLS